MKKIKKLFLIIVLLIPLVGCQSQKNEWKGTYHLTYFYLKDCSNCQHFKKNVLPAIKKEFGKHMKIKAYDMDDEQTFDEMKESYQNHIDQIIDFKNYFYVSDRSRGLSGNIKRSRKIPFPGDGFCRYSCHKFLLCPALCRVLQ